MKKKNLLHSNNLDANQLHDMHHEVLQAAWDMPP